MVPINCYRSRDLRASTCPNLLNCFPRIFLPERNRVLLHPSPCSSLPMSTYASSEASASSYTRFTGGSMDISRSPSTVATEQDELDIIKIPSSPVSRGPTLRPRVASDSAAVGTRKRAWTSSARPQDSEKTREAKRLKLEEKKAVSIHLRVLDASQVLSLNLCWAS